MDGWVAWKDGNQSCFKGLLRAAQKYVEEREDILIYVNTKVERVSLELAKMSFQSHEPKLEQFYKELSLVKQNQV